MDVINKCNSLNFCPARTMPAMSLVLKHCHPMMSFYLGRQRDNDGKFNLCMQDLLNIVQSKKRVFSRPVTDSTRSNACLCLICCLGETCHRSYQINQTFDDVSLVELVPSITETREHIHRYRVCGIVLKEEDFNTLESQNWVNDTVHMNTVHFLSLLKINNAVKS